MVREVIKEALVEAVKKSFPDAPFVREENFAVDIPKEMSHGDFSAPIALSLKDKLGKISNEIAEALAANLQKNKRLKGIISKVEIAGPGFINFFLSDEYLAKMPEEIFRAGKDFGKNNTLFGKKVIVEYTDPNPFKEFHIGHLMNNTIGESIARLFESRGAEVRRACYQGDIGLHVAKALWGLKKINPEVINAKTLGEAYAFGSKSYEEGEGIKEEIIILNKKIFLGEDKGLMKIYTEGRKISLETFEKIYATLGTKFDYYFFESETGEYGKRLVKENIGTIFEESDGALVFKGENYNPSLHTRVFINSEGLPTYEAKELGLAKTKFDKYPYDISVVVTGNEIKDYFRVLLEALRQLFPELAKRTIHEPHGMLKLPTGKMSSRKGTVITAEDFIKKAEDEVMAKIKKNDYLEEERKNIAEYVAIGAIKFSILRQAIGHDIIFDLKKSLSFEGDSGPYVQYTRARINSLLKKGAGMLVESPSLLKASVSTKVTTDKMAGKEKNLIREALRFEDVVARAGEDIAPQLVVNYLLGLASSFNNFYASEQFIKNDDKFGSVRRLFLARAVGIILENGLSLLGIKAPERM